MKVGDRKQVPNPALGGIATPGEAGAAGSPPPAPASAEDQVRVSQAARALARLITQVEGEEPDIRTEKVEPLRAAVARGEYRVDVQATARKFLREVLGDLAR